MLRKSLAAIFVSLFITGAAFASPPPVSGGANTSEKAGQLSGTLSLLHAVSQWSSNLSEMADTRAKSDLVKNYARTMANANATIDQRLPSIAQKHGFEIAPAGRLQADPLFRGVSAQQANAAPVIPVKRIMGCASCAT